MIRIEGEKSTQELVGSTIARQSSRFIEAGQPYHCQVKEIARETGLNYHQVIGAVIKGTSPVPTILEDADGIPVNGNLNKAIENSVPWNRVRNGNQAIYLGEGRLRIEPIPPQPISAEPSPRNFITKVASNALGAMSHFFQRP